ncbi:MAG: hypothetical protein LBS50_10585 [Prevotellaceae bacterium]|jgi:hypothetical protein|nr:hypothetical protein [Prevotellaceae bacterium]
MKNMYKAVFRAASTMLIALFVLSCKAPVITPTDEDFKIVIDGAPTHYSKSVSVENLLGATSIPFEHLSENGRYVAGEYDKFGLVFDLTQIENEDYAGIVFDETYDNGKLITDNSFALRGITNSGEPFARGVTADGTATVKITNRTAGRTFYTPYVVKNGVETQLDFPESRPFDAEMYKGVIPDLISADGKYILGRISEAGPIWTACKWEFNGSKYIFGEIGGDLIDYKPETYAFLKYPAINPATGLSAYGKYSCGEITVPGTQGDLNPDGAPAKYIPYFYNLQKNTLQTISDEADARGTYVTDDGVFFYATPFYTNGEKTPYVFMNNVKKSFYDWVKEIYGLDIPAAKKGFVSAVSKDYKVVVWVTKGAGGFTNNFIIVK